MCVLSIMYVLTEPCMRSVLDELNTIKEELRVAKEARNAEAFGSDDYKLRNEEVQRISNQVVALHNRIAAADKSACKVTHTHTYIHFADAGCGFSSFC